jgi:hypothetical protein
MEGLFAGRTQICWQSDAATPTTTRAALCLLAVKFTVHVAGNCPSFIRP